MSDMSAHRGSLGWPGAYGWAGILTEGRLDMHAQGIGRELTYVPPYRSAGVYIAMI